MTHSLHIQGVEASPRSLTSLSLATRSAEGLRCLRCHMNKLPESDQKQSQQPQQPQPQRQQQQQSIDDDLVPPIETADGIYTAPPLFPNPDENATTGSKVKLDIQHEQLNEQKEKLTEKLSKLSHAQLVQHVVDSQYALHEWRHTCSDILSVLTLSPEMTDVFYSRSLRNLLKSALESLESVDCLRHLECSMPSIAAERPFVDIIRWDGLNYSEWKIIWSPKSWWVSVSADGSKWGLAFNCLANVSAISLNAKIQCSFSPDLTSLRLRFMEKPKLNMSVETNVGWGFVPIPVQQSIQDIIKSQIHQVVDSRLCNPQGMVVVLRRKPSSESVSDNDIYEATMAAKRANEVRLRSPSFF